MDQLSFLVRLKNSIVAGYDDDSDSRRFEEARQIIESTIKDR